MQKTKKGAKAKRATKKNIASTPAAVGALKTRAACVYLGRIHPATLARLVNRGLIRPNKMLRHNIYPIRELDRYLEAGVVE